MSDQTDKPTDDPPRAPPAPEIIAIVKAIARGAARAEFERLQAEPLQIESQRSPQRDCG